MKTRNRKPASASPEETSLVQSSWAVATERRLQPIPVASRARAASYRGPVGRSRFPWNIGC